IGIFDLERRDEAKNRLVRNGDRHQALRIGEIQQPQQDATHDRKNRRVRAMPIARLSTTIAAKPRCLQSFLSVDLIGRRSSAAAMTASAAKRLQIVVL